MTTRVPIALLLAFSVAAPALGADERDAVEVLFGEKIRKVTATAARADDVALAGEMIAATVDANFGRENIRAVREKAAELAMKDASGFSLVLELAKGWPADDPQGTLLDKRMEMLARIQQAGRPPERAAAGEGQVDLLVGAGEQRWDEGNFADAAAMFRRASTLAVRAKPGDAPAIKSRLEQSAYRERLARTIELLKTKVLESRTDTASAESLIRLLLIEQQDAGAAAGYLDAAKDEALKAAVTLARKPVVDLSAAEAMRLGEWFLEASRSLQGIASEAALRQAKPAYERAVEADGLDELSKTKASLQVKAIELRLAKADVLPPTATGRPKERTIDLLAMIDPDKHAIDRPWSKVNGKLLNPRTDKRTRIAMPAWPKGDYALAATFTRLTGDQSVTFLLPVDDTQIACGIDAKLDSGAYISGIENIDGRNFVDNKTTVRGAQLTTGKAHRVRIEVKRKDSEVSIIMELDGKPFAKWSGPKSSLSPNGIWRTKDLREPAIGMAASEFSFSEIKLRTVGEVVETRKE